MFEVQEAVANAMLDAGGALVDAGAGAGKAKIYDASGNLLSEHTLSPTAFAAAAGGSLDSNAIVDVNGTATGVASTADVTDSNDVVRFHGDCGLTGSDAFCELSNTTITQNEQVQCTGISVTISNLITP